ncbi:MAG: cupin domain-containing protein [Candidatus Bathyarchaeota archaeon]|nr:cupin domain-containing protein [Candidatus Bathyarchaeota archaeon]
MAEKSVDMKGKAVKLKGLVEYQKGSVVSRTVIDKKTGTVTLFAFDEGEGLSEHAAPFDAMVINLEGTVEVKIAGVSNRLEEGDVIIMPANKPHALKALTRFKMMLVMIKAT